MKQDFELSTSLMLRIPFFSDITPCSGVKRSQRLEWITLLFSSTFWDEGTNFHLKRRNLLTPLHSVTSGKTSILSVRAYCTTSDKGGRPARMYKIESSWNVMAHGDAREGKWRWNWRMEWVASTLHTISEHCVSSIATIITADAFTTAASSRLNWRPLPI
jgi:hypothetical protein